MSEEYRIVVRNDPSSLERVVCDMMQEGWVPVGGVAVALTHHDGYNFHSIWAQAMVRVRPEEEQA